MQMHVIQNPMFDSKSLKLMYEQLCRDYAYASEIASMSGRHLKIYGQQLKPLLRKQMREIENFYQLELF